MPRKGKRARITPDILIYIGARALQRPHIQRTELAKTLQNEIRAQGQDVPEVEVLERKISSARNHPVSPLDEPWSLGSLAEYGIPPDALPAVMWVYRKRLRQLEPYFTIREAMWIARLYKIIDNTDLLEHFAQAYATHDLVCWVLGLPSLTRRLDIQVFRQRDYLGEDRFPHAFWSGEWESIEKKLNKKGYSRF